MPRPDTVLKSVKTAIKESDRLPDATSYSTFELDTDGGQSNVRPPVVEITIVDTIRSRPHNTDFVEYIEDDNGNHIGRIYDAKFEMPIQIDVWTAEGDKYDPYEIGEEVRRALYRHDSYMAGDPLPDPSDPSQLLGGIDRFTVDDGRVANDLSMTPALRRWRQTGEVWFRETVEVTADNDYVKTVESPKPGTSEAGNEIEIVFDVTPATESAADEYTS
jgi:hypothetical protein